MYIALMGCAQQGAGAASLGLTVADGGGGTEVEVDTEIFSASSVNIAIRDFIGLTATASGGAGGNSFAWTNTELVDSDGAGGTGVWSVNTSGTTNQATYNGLVLTCDASSGSGGQEFEGVYRITCTVTDSAGATASANYTFSARVICAF
jgi:hypothetical protein|tara:strand:+ start:83 stop:529 length:447 start_codon:yes stop_codon:yes gene_type:complete